MKPDEADDVERRPKDPETANEGNDLNQIGSCHTETQLELFRAAIWNGSGEEVMRWSGESTVFSRRHL